MKKIYILLVLLLLSSIGVLAQDEVVNIPDARFKQTLLNHDPVIDTNNDGEIQKSEAEAFTGKLDLKNKAIPNLKGIEYFVNITELDCSKRNVTYSKLTQLDISKNINLITVNCSYNELTELILPNSTKLENLYCTYNKLFALDLSGNSGLKKIFCANNRIKNLNIPQNNSIVELECSNNALSDLDVKHIKGLEILKCDKNILTDLDVNENTQLTLLNCSSNLLKSIDISKNIKLESFFCLYNIISVLDVSGNLKLTTINCNGNVISKLNLTNNTLLEELYCAGNEITDIKFAEAKTFNKIICSGNKLKPSQCFTVIDKIKDSGVYNYSPQENLFSEIYNNKPFTVDYSSETKIDDKDSEFKWFNRFDKEVDNTEIIMPIAGQPGKFEIKTVGKYYCKISNPVLKGEFVTNSVNLNTNEKTIDIPDYNFKRVLLDIEKLNTNGDDEIQLSEAKVFSGMLDIGWGGINDLSGIEYFENLDSLRCYNKINNLDLTQNKKLIYLDISNCELSNLDNIPKSQLRYLNCSNNYSLGELDLSEFTNLKELSCYDCKLTSLDLSAVPDLELLVCSDNNINELDISGLTKLRKLRCYDNKLSVLDVSKNSLLETLSCSRNSLESLDVSKNSLLEALYCSHNNLKSLDISKNSKVKKLYIQVNPISELLICDKPLYTEVYCGSTKLNLIDVWNLKKKLSEGCKLVYSIEDNKEYKVYQSRSETELFEVDYSDQSVINGKNTDYKWYSLSKSGVITDNSIIEQVQDSPGKFIIKATGAYYCKLTNTEIPDFSLTTNVVGIYTDSDIVNIPDVVFKSYLVNNKNINTNRDTEIQLSEAENYTGGISLSYHYDVEDITGIEYFTNLTTLFISRNNLKMVDLSENIGLLNLRLSNNSLSEIDLSKNINLLEVNLSGNELTKIDISNQLQLIELICYGNEIENLDISLNVKLKRLSCGDNKLNSLDLSNNPDLTSLACRNNNLTTLDLSKNNKIEDLYCISNNISNLDVSALKSITRLNCSDNKLTELDLSNNTKLNSLSCNDNNLTKLDLSDLYSIGEINCDNNSLTYLNIEKTNHCRLSCSENRLTLSDLHRIKRLNSPYMFSYISNKKAYEPVTGGINYEIDYTADAIIDGNRTKFVWCNAENGVTVGTDAVQEIGNGKFKFKKFGDYYCLMSNKFLQVRTNIVRIERKEQTLNFDPATTAKVNDKITFNATASTGLEVTYQIVSGEATLDGNILTPTAEGTLTVKAIQAGNNEYEPIEKTATIQVSKREQTITFDVKETAKLNEKITLAATASSNLDVTYEVVSGNGTLDCSTVTFTEVGKVQIKAKQAGNNEYKAVEKVVTITVTKSTAIDNLSVIGAKIYPNPVTDILNIELPTTGSYRVTVLNSIGDVVTQKTTQSVNTTIDMSVYNSGIYIIKVTTGNRSYTGKIIKQ